MQNKEKPVESLPESMRKLTKSLGARCVSGGAVRVLAVGCRLAPRSPRYRGREESRISWI